MAKLWVTSKYSSPGIEQSPNLDTLTMDWQIHLSGQVKHREVLSFDEPQFFVSDLLIWRPDQPCQNGRAHCTLPTLLDIPHPG